MRKDPDSRIEKLYYRIGEAATLVGVKPHVLRHWETEFQTIRPRKSKSGQRIYTKDQITMLLKVRTLLREQRFTIAGAKRALRTGTGMETPVLLVASPLLEPDPSMAPAFSAVPAVTELRLRAALNDLRDEAAALLRRLDDP